MNLNFRFDENLREVPEDADAFKAHIKSLEHSLKSETDPKQQIRLLGETGTYLRILSELDKAEELLVKALKIISDHKMGLRLEVQQKIRLAHVLQWKKDFKQSDQIFLETLQICRTHADVESYLPFALQHMGKNYFDQNRLMEALRCFEEALKIRKKKTTKIKTEMDKAKVKFKSVVGTTRK